MKRWIYFLLCLICGAALLAVGLLTPVHLRAVESSVIQRAGRDSVGLVERGLALVKEGETGAAELMWHVARDEQIDDHEKLGAALDQAQKGHPELQILGIDSRLKTVLAFSRVTSGKIQTNGSFTALIIQKENREKVLSSLRGSPSLAVQGLLRCQSLTNTVLFPPSQSSAGQAFDVALSIAGLLLEEHRLLPGLSNVLATAASASLRGETSQPLEQMLLDFMSLGQRFNWGQLVTFCEKIQDPETLRLQANLARKSDIQLPLLFTAVQLSGRPAEVARYLMIFSQTGPKDLATSLHFGMGGVNELLNRMQRLHQTAFAEKLNSSPRPLVYLSWQSPELALALKWFLYLSAGFLFALALHFARPATPVAEHPFQVRNYHVAREILFGLGFLLVVLLMSEPFLAQENQSMEFRIRLQLPTVGSAVLAKTPNDHGSIMNQLSLLTLLLFFVLQALIYVSCLFKLAEIRRQTFPSHIKLKLLENEEHLFDAGLYLGFAGTIISLILVSMGVIKPSLMAAYSSTSFGVIFVSVFKIFHLRPLRRKLLLEAEAAKNMTVAPSERPLSAPL